VKPPVRPYKDEPKKEEDICISSAESQEDNTLPAPKKEVKRPNTSKERKIVSIATRMTSSMNDIYSKKKQDRPGSMGDLADVLKDPEMMKRLSTPRHERVLKRLIQTEEAESIEVGGKKFNEREFFRLSQGHKLDDLMKDYN
jgi:hypothetical protein